MSAFPIPVPLQGEGQSIFPSCQKNEPSRKNRSIECVSLSVQSIEPCIISVCLYCGSSCTRRTNPCSITVDARILYQKVIKRGNVCCSSHHSLILFYYSNLSNTHYILAPFTHFSLMHQLNHCITATSS